MFDSNSVSLHPLDSADPVGIEEDPNPPELSAGTVSSLRVLEPDPSLGLVFKDFFICSHIRSLESRDKPTWHFT